MQHTVHVEQNRGHGRRVYSVGTAVPLLTVERAGRPACAEELDAGRGDLRRRGLGRAQRGRAAPGAREARPDGACDLPGRALAAAQSRARDRADRRAGRRGGEAPAEAPADEAVGCRARAQARGEAPAGRPQAGAAAAGRRRLEQRPAVADGFVVPRVGAVDGTEDADGGDHDAGRRVRTCPHYRRALSLDQIEL